MIAVLPFWEMRMLPDGVRVVLGSIDFVIPTMGVPVDPWATLVCLGVLLGLEVARARALRMGLEPKDIVDGVVFTVLTGFFFAHVITVVGYYPGRLVGEPAGASASARIGWSETASQLAAEPSLLFTEGIWAILRVWEGFSSTGGWIGGVLGMWIFYRIIRPMDLWRFADLIGFGLPLGWFFGRLGCAVVHDHIGKKTDFFLGVAFPQGYGDAGGVRHELGFYEVLYMIPVMALFWHLAKKDQPPGTFLGLFFLTYAPVRFLLDFLRNADLSHQDARYFGLTPAQYGTFVMFGMAAWLLWSRDTENFKPWPLDYEPDQEARAQGLAATPTQEPAGA